MIKAQLRIIIRPSFPEKRDILFEADVTNLDIPFENLNQLMFDIELALNTIMPQIRAHSNIEVTETKK